MGVTRTGAPSAAHTYDATGQRIAKKVNGMVTRFVWRGGHVAYETTEGGTLTRSYTWGTSTDDLVAIHDHEGGGHYYIVQDRLRSVRALLDDAGAWQASWRYELFGATLYESGQVPFTVRFRWAGAQYDEETGFYYLRSRYHDPVHGRFIQEDPIGLAGGVNLYAYADGDPTSARDPSGMGAEPEPEDRSPYACLGTIRGCGDTSGDRFLGGPGGGGGGGGGGWTMFDQLDWQWIQTWAEAGVLSVVTKYLHLSSLSQGIKAGVMVAKGQQIGLSGFPEHPHLHYVMEVNGRAVNGNLYGGMFGFGDPLRPMPGCSGPRGCYTEELVEHPYTHELGYHRALDFPTRMGTPVYAASDGLVTFAGRASDGSGLMVRIQHWVDLWAIRYR